MAPVEERDERIGSRIAGKLLVEERLGAGGAGVVYRALQEPLGRRVALKILTSTEAGAARRFEREAQAIARLKHENIVAIYDYGSTADGAPWIAMEHIEGRSLRALLETGERISLDDAVDVARGIARALVHAHAAGVAHRDLKPENVMLEHGKPAASAVRVVDFGLARVSHVDAGAGVAGGTVSATIAGTPAYMAPEQIEAKPDVVVGAPSDVYALGVILYELVCGWNPFRAETAFKTLLRHVEGPLPPAPSTSTPALPRALDELVLASLAKDPSARPTAARFLALLDSLTTAASAPTHDERAARLAKRAEAAAEPVPTGVIAFGIVVIFVIIGVLIAHYAIDIDDDDAAAGAVDAGAVGAVAVVVDAGAAGAAVAVDAGEVGAVVDAGSARIASRAREQPKAALVVDAGAAAPVSVADAGSSATTPPTTTAAPPALVRKVQELDGCREPCAEDVKRRFEYVVGGELDVLKRWRDDLEACRERCRR